MSGITNLPDDSFVIDVERSVLKRIENSISRRERAEFTIFKAPPSLRHSGADAYEPKIMSIGPYHRGKKRLKAMEEHKSHYLHCFRQRNPTLGLNDYIKRMMNSEQDARRCYSEDIAMGSKEFVEMMLVDGCFVVEFLVRLAENRDVDDDFPLVGTKWTSTYVYFDTLRLENQLPFFILQELFDMANITNEHTFIKFLLHDTPFRRLSCSSIPGKEFVPDHLLHLFHVSLVQYSNHNRHGIRGRDPLRYLSCESMMTFCCKAFCFVVLLWQKAAETTDSRTARRVMELQEAGVRFIKIKDKGSFLDIKFSDGALEMAPLYLGDFTIPLLLNFIALEQCNRKYGSNFTSYACFMDDLVDTPADVEILEREGVLINDLGSNEEAASLINRLCKGIVHNSSKDHFKVVLEDMKKYCNSSWPRWRAKLARDYFSNPWAILSLVAAIILLLLTITQTSFTVLQYVSPKP